MKCAFQNSCVVPRFCVCLFALLFLPRAFHLNVLHRARVQASINVDQYDIKRVCKSQWMLIWHKVRNSCKWYCILYIYVLYIYIHYIYTLYMTWMLTSHPTPPQLQRSIRCMGTLTWMLFAWHQVCVCVQVNRTLLEKHQALVKVPVNILKPQFHLVMFWAICFKHTMSLFSPMCNVISNYCEITRSTMY